MRRGRDCILQLNFIWNSKFYELCSVHGACERSRDGKKSNQCFRTHSMWTWNLSMNCICRRPIWYDDTYVPPIRWFKSINRGKTEKINPKFASGQTETLEVKCLQPILIIDIVKRVQSQVVASVKSKWKESATNAVRLVILKPTEILWICLDLDCSNQQRYIIQITNKKTSRIAFVFESSCVPPMQRNE